MQDDPPTGRGGDRTGRLGTPDHVDRSIEFVTQRDREELGETDRFVDQKDSGHHTPVLAGQDLAMVAPGCDKKADYRHAGRTKRQWRKF
jgi:hypothetical protein